MRVFAVWNESNGLVDKLKERCDANVVHISELAGMSFMPDDILAYDSSCIEVVEAAMCRSVLNGVQPLLVLFYYEPHADDDSIFTRLIVNDIAELELFIKTLDSVQSADAQLGCDSRDIAVLFSKGRYAKLQAVEATEKDICSAMEDAAAKLISDVNISVPTDVLVSLTVPLECALDTVTSAVESVSAVLEGKASIKMAVSYSTDGDSLIKAVIIAAGMKVYN